uniref:MCMDC2 N-terminal domain-containing protein n=1 Tax=Salarias fasciatus TaxID=181472 RepID=A0A672IQU0_SALFA
MADVLSLKQSILIYLERSGGLERLAEDCEPYNDPQRTEAVYRFNVSVHPSDVMEVDPELGDCLLHDPLTATTLFQSACFQVIKSLSLIGKLQTESQVNVILNYTHLPPFPEYTLDLCRFPRVHRPVRPVSMEGLVIAITRVTKYTQGARFLCTNDDCPSAGGFHHIRVHTPGATESAVVRNDFSCTNCRSPLTEDVKFRVLGGEIISGQQRTSTSESHCFVFLTRTDELCNSMRIGRRYRLLGIPAHVHKWPNIACSVEANRVQPWNKVSASFQRLLRETSSSLWRFSAVVAHCFGLHVAPPGSYNTLKLSLLLSLMQTTTDAEDTFHNVDLLVVTTDTLIVDRFKGSET